MNTIPFGIGRCRISVHDIVLTFSFSFSIGVAASARVGNLIGARLPNAAKRAAHASALLSVVVGGIVMIVLIATKDVSSGRQGHHR